MSLLYLKTCTPEKGTPWSTAWPICLGFWHWKMAWIFRQLWVVSISQEEDKRATTNVQHRFVQFFLLSFLLFCSPWAKTLSFEGESPGGKNYEKVWKSVKNYEKLVVALEFFPEFPRRQSTKKPQRIQGKFQAGGYAKGGVLAGMISWSVRWTGTSGTSQGQGESFQVLLRKHRKRRSHEAMNLHHLHQAFQGATRLGATGLRGSERKMALWEGLWEGFWKTSENL